MTVRVRAEAKIGLRLMICAIGLIGLFASRAVARDLIWVTVEGEAPVVAGATDKARGQAIAAAERQAVAVALAKGISVNTLLVNLRLSGNIVGAIPFGRVVKKKILKEQLVNAANDEASQQAQRFHVRMRAGVVKETGGEDLSFHLDATINQSVFKDGDELEIHIRSTKDCYFTIFNILEDQKVIRLLPNYLSQKNFLAANESYIFPGTKDHHKGLRLRVHLPPKRAHVTESIYILALAHPFELKSINVREGIFGAFNGQTIFMQDIIREVVGIPIANRAEALIQYEIRKTSNGI